MEYRVLGPLEVLGDDGPLRLGGAKQRAVLALLLLHSGRVVSQERFIDELWGEAAARDRARDGAGVRLAAPESVARGRAGHGGRRLCAAGRAGRRRPGAVRAACAAERSIPRGAARSGGAAARRVRRGRSPRVEGGGSRSFDSRPSRSGSMPTSPADATPSCRRARGSGRRAPASRAAARPADAGALPLRPPGRGAGRVPRRPARSRRARHRAERTAAAPRAADPHAGRGAHAAAATRRHGARTSSRTRDVVRRAGTRAHRDRRLLTGGGARVVTLTGAAGAGKSRLAVEVASRVAHAFPDGVFFVALEDVRDPALVVPAIASALGVDAVADPRRSGIGAVGGPACVARRSTTSSRCWTPLLPSLDGDGGKRLPGDEPGSAEHRRRAALSGPALAQSDARALFVERARAVRPDFHTSRAVGEICRRLDGLPLAIELAAARVRLMTPEVMLPRLGDRLSLLTRGSERAFDTTADAASCTRLELRPARRTMRVRSSRVCPCSRRLRPVGSRGHLRRRPRELPGACRLRPDRDPR